MPSSRRLTAESIVLDQPIVPSVTIQKSAKKGSVLKNSARKSTPKKPRKSSPYDMPLQRPPTHKSTVLSRSCII